MSRLRWWLTEWGLPIAVGLPLAGVVIWLTENPPLGEPLLVNAILGALMGGGLLGAVRVATWWDDDELEDDGFRWRWVWVSAVFGAWLMVSMPWIFQPPDFSPVDLVLRGSWTCAGLALVGLAAVRGVKGSVVWIGALFGVENLLLYGVGELRTLGMVTGVLWMLGMWLYAPTPKE